MKYSEGLAYRRAQVARLKHVRQHYWGAWLKTPKQIGKMVHTPALCSCHMCGNPRKYEHTRTIQELKQLEQLDYDLMELDSED